MLVIQALLSQGTNIETSLCRSPETGRFRSKLVSFLLFHSQSCPIMKGGAEQLGNHRSHYGFLLVVPEAISSHTKTRTISSTRSYHLQGQLS